MKNQKLEDMKHRYALADNLYAEIRQFCNNRASNPTLTEYKIEKDAIGHIHMAFSIFPLDRDFLNNIIDKFEDVDTVKTNIKFGAELLEQKTNTVNPIKVFTSIEIDIAFDREKDTFKVSSDDKMVFRN